MDRNLQEVIPEDIENMTNATTTGITGNNRDNSTRNQINSLD